ncbi:two-component response regulator ARR15-like [Papaver somniferum]|uniref:two-component response regulator ARR15-like n=1 Tax=Papaver somniferum TaxID=3469 RepID=UPI000E6FAB40|nr:two-component response regulator ARR15-like [Papaver somniferum]
MDKKSNFFNVLVVDDDHINRNIFEKYFSKMSSSSSTSTKSSSSLVFKVTTVESGNDALDKLLPDNMLFQLVVTDYEMPSMTGYGLLKTIKGKPSLRNIPVVVMSSEKKFSDECLKAGALKFIEKPVKFLDVETLLTQLSS